MAKVLCGVFLSVLVLVSVCFGITAVHRQNDPLVQATNGTKYQLARFEKTGDAGPLKAWLRSHNDGGIAMNTYTTMARWSLTHQREFIHFLHTLSPAEARTFSEAFCWQAADSGLQEAFRSAYKGCEDPALLALLTHEYNLVPWSEPHAPSSHSGRSAGGH